MIKIVLAFFPFLDLYPKKIEPRFIKCKNLLFWGTVFLLTTIGILLVGYSIFGDSLFESPDQENLFILFLKISFSPCFFSLLPGLLSH